jgi:hypothetical protein
MAALSTTGAIARCGGSMWRVRHFPGSGGHRRRGRGGGEIRHGGFFCEAAPCRDRAHGRAADSVSRPLRLSARSAGPSARQALSRPRHSSGAPSPRVCPARLSADALPGFGTRVPSIVATFPAAALRRSNEAATAVVAVATFTCRRALRCCPPVPQQVALQGCRHCGRAGHLAIRRRGDSGCRHGDNRRRGRDTCRACRRSRWPRSSCGAGCYNFPETQHSASGRRCGNAYTAVAFTAVISRPARARRRSPSRWGGAGKPSGTVPASRRSIAVPGPSLAQLFSPAPRHRKRTLCQALAQLCHSRPVRRRARRSHRQMAAADGRGE